MSSLRRFVQDCLHRQDAAGSARSATGAGRSLTPIKPRTPDRTRPARLGQTSTKLCGTKPRRIACRSSYWHGNTAPTATSTDKANK